MCKEYNGWTNYETWAVSLWIDNDQGLYNYVQELTIQAIEDKPEYPVSQLADMLKDFHEENNPCNEQANVYSDLMQAALDSVNWDEIARGWVDTAKNEGWVEVEEEPEDEDQ